MCYDGMRSLDVDYMWDLFKSLARYQWHHEKAGESLVCPSPISYDLHAYSLLMCASYQYFEHEVNSCPYYDIFDACHARFKAVIETMNERRECFVGKIRECGLLHKTDPNPSSPRLEVSLYDDYESSLPLESSFIDVRLSIDLGKVFDPPLTPSSLVAPSLPSKPRDITGGVLSLLSTPLPLP